MKQKESTLNATRIEKRKHLYGLPWFDDRCIYCLEEGQMSWQHVIPRSIGGRLALRNVCKNCNDAIGLDIESRAKEDPSIRLAISNLRMKLPHLFDQMEDGQKYAVKHPTNSTGSELIHAVYRRGVGYQTRTRKLTDGKFIVDYRDTDTIQLLLKRSGGSARRVSIQRDDTIKPVDNSIVAITPEIEVANLTRSALFPSLDGPFIDLRLIVKICYEYLALLVGDGIYNDFFDPIRESVKEKLDAEFVSVEQLTARRYQTGHSVHFEPASRDVQMVVRIFGWLYFKVRFPRYLRGSLSLVYLEDIEGSQTLFADNLKDAEENKFWEFAPK